MCDDTIVYETVLEKMIADKNEVMLYLMIDSLGAYIWRMNHNLADGRIASTDEIEKSLVLASKTQIKILKAMEGIGFDGFLDSEGKGTKKYWSWYKWWSKWHKEMSDEEWVKVDAMLGENMTPEQIAYCRPNTPIEDEQEKPQ